MSLRQLVALLPALAALPLQPWEVLQVLDGSSGSFGVPGAEVVQGRTLGSSGDDELKEGAAWAGVPEVADGWGGVYQELMLLRVREAGGAGDVLADPTLSVSHGAQAELASAAAGAVPLEVAVQTVQVSGQSLQVNCQSRVYCARA